MMDAIVSRPPLWGLLLLLLVLSSNATRQQLFTCGYNRYAQLGLGDTQDHTTLQQMTGLSAPWIPSNVTSVSSGFYHSIMIGNNHVYTVGYSSAGQLGRSGTSIGTQFLTPYVIGDADVPWQLSVTISLVAAGYQHNMVLAGGQVFSFGDNSYGQLGLGTTTTTYSTPQAVNGTNAPWGNSSVTTVAAGQSHSLILAGGVVYLAGTLGTTKSTSPVALTATWGQNKVTMIVSGVAHAFILAGGEAFVMGSGVYGQLGLGSRMYTSSAVVVSGPWSNNTVTLAAAGSYHSLVVAGGWLYAFGSNSFGQLGLPNVSQATTPIILNSTDIPWAVGSISAVVAGEAHNVLLSGGVLYVWGDNSHGQLGQGNTQQYGVPVLLSSDLWLNYTITQIQAKYSQTFVIADPIPSPSPSPQASPVPDSARLCRPSAVLLLLVTLLLSCML